MIGILQAGAAPAPLIDEFGDYPSMIIDLLQGSQGGLDFRTYRVFDGQLPDSIDDCSAWVISGSRHSVNDKLPWINKLMEFIRDAAARKKRMVGICFGHQIMAVAFGGSVERSENGWIAGRQKYELLTPGQSPTSIGLNAFHQDQIVILPKQARVLGQSKSCPYAFLEYGSNAFSVQAHPEFNNQYTSALISHRLGDKLPQPEFEKSLVGLSRRTDSDLVADWMFRTLL